MWVIGQQLADMEFIKSIENMFLNIYIYILHFIVEICQLLLYIIEDKRNKFCGVPLCKVTYKLERMLLSEILKDNAGI
jgi:hypothetical protein